MQNDGLSHYAAYSKTGASVSAGRIILFSLLAVIGAGALLLKLPFACTQPISWFQSLFTAVSTTCVTGLAIVPFHEFSLFGKLVLLILIQIGGLGLMTFSFFLTWSLLGSFGVAEKLMASEILNFERLGKMQHFLKLVLLLTFGIELIGALLLLPKMLQYFPWPLAIFNACFYSVSAFCNAGIVPNVGGLVAFGGDNFINLILALLVFVGGLGFPVLYELIEKARFRLAKLRDAQVVSPRISLHSKIVLSSSVALVLIGMAITWISQIQQWSDILLWQKLTRALYHSIFLRNAGFLVQPIAQFSKQTLFASTLLMLVGSSPGSTGGGLKTSTLVVIFASILATLKGKMQTTIFNRAIPLAQVIKAFSIVFLGVCSLFAVIIALLITDFNVHFFYLFFEAISAISTTGITLGITADLSFAGQVVLLLAMIAGRIGSLTFMFAFRRRLQNNTYKLPEERIFIG